MTTASCEVRGTKLALREVLRACDGVVLPPSCIRGVITLVTAPPDDDRLFVVELHGAIRIVEEGVLRAEPFLDLTAESGGPVNGVGISELGLLGLAFAPDYATSGTFYVFYTTDNPDTADTEHPYLNVLARYRVSADANRADLSSGEVLLAIKDPYPNHNGGMIAFGPDGMLYVSTGDGGGDGTKPPDAFGHAQNPQSLLGKILRVDVSTGSYAVPADNPFDNEVYILGLRNPWRWSFDRVTGDMWIGDVGQAKYEELNVLRAGQQAGVNLGWKMYEGPDCFEAPCDPTGMTFPLESRPQTMGWWSIIGGEVYRGRCFPDLVGTYVYTDTGASQIFTAKLQADGSLTSAASGGFFASPASLHGDAHGELYVTDIFGNVSQIVVESD